MLVKKIVDSCSGIEKLAYCKVVVKSVNDMSNVLAHTNLCIPGLGEKLGSSINKVCSKYSCNSAISISLVEKLKTVAEKTEGCKYKYALCPTEMNTQASPTGPQSSCLYL